MENPDKQEKKTYGTHDEEKQSKITAQCKLDTTNKRK